MKIYPRKARLLAAVLLVASLSGSAYCQMTSEQAFELGRQVGNTQAPASEQLVRGANAHSSVPGAGTTTGQQYFMGGQGSTQGPGTQQMLECAGADAQQLAGYGGKACDATNFLTRNPQTRPNVSINRNDTLLKNLPPTSMIKNIGSDFGIGAGNQPQKCTTTNQPGTNTYATQTCYEDVVLKDSTCIVGQTVTVDQKFVYECNTQPKKISKLTCDKIVNEACTSAQRTETCPDGTTPKDGMCTSSSTRTDTAAINYHCPAGQTLSGNQCVSSEIAGVSISNYTCPAGQTVSGSQCLIQETIPASSSNTCPQGYTLSAGNCIRFVTSPQPATPTYYCPSGYNLAGFNCIKQEEKATDVITKCPAGYTLIAGTYNCQATSTTPAPQTQVCPNNFYQYDQWPAFTGYCMHINNLPYSSRANLYYAQEACNDWRAANYSRFIWTNGGNWADHLCLVTPQVRYNCPAGTTLSGTSCLSTVYLPADLSLTCQAGYELEGSLCKKTTTIDASIFFYKCPAGQFVSGSQCLIFETIPASSSNTCPQGYTLSASSCTRTVTSPQPATPTYYCPEGFTLSGNSCSKEVRTPATPSYSCKEGGTLQSDGKSCSYFVTTNSEATENFSCSASGARLTAGVLQAGKQTYVCCTENTVNQCQTLEGLVK